MQERRSDLVEETKKVTRFPHDSIARETNLRTVHAVNQRQWSQGPMGQLQGEHASRRTLLSAAGSEQRARFPIQRLE
jgi:hypothetical protein